LPFAARIFATTVTTSAIAGDLLSVQRAPSYRDGRALSRRRGVSATVSAAIPPGLRAYNQAQRGEVRRMAKGRSMQKEKKKPKKTKK
jgi:hypothetical protein